MPKNKTHSGAKKRFRVTGSGKLMREQANKRHLLEVKSSRRKRKLSQDQPVARPTSARLRSCSVADRPTHQGVSPWHV